MSDTVQRADDTTPESAMGRRRVRWERLGIGAAVGLVFMTAMGSAWMMLIGAGVGLGVVLVWEVARPRV